MHIHGITCEQLAIEMGVSKAYVSMILSSKREPKDARQRLESAVNSIISKRNC